MKTPMIERPLFDGTQTEDLRAELMKLAEAAGRLAPVTEDEVWSRAYGNACDAVFEMARQVPAYVLEGQRAELARVMEMHLRDFNIMLSVSIKSKAMKEKKAKQNLQSPNERISAQERGFTQNGRKQMEMVFGDLDQPITDIMWMLGCKFLFDVPDWLS